MKSKAKAKPILSGVSAHIAIFLAVAVVVVVALGILFSPQPATPSAAPEAPVAPTTPEPVAPTPEPVAPEPTTSTPEPEPKPEEPTVTKSDTTLDITKNDTTITFTTGYDVCEDQTLEWNCLTEDGITTCMPGELGSGAMDTITVTCLNYDSPMVMEEFTEVIA